MVPTSGDVIVSGSIHPEFSGGTQLGKRYVDGDEQVNVLCTKSGQGLALARWPGTAPEGPPACPCPGTLSEGAHQIILRRGMSGHHPPAGVGVPDYPD